MYQIINNLDHQARNIQWLEFELSNNCQYSEKHPWCPRYYDKRSLIFLKTEIIHKVIQFFKQYNFSGRIYLSGYSEPLIDPRLIDIVKYIKSQLPLCNIDMFTNGLAADENLLYDVLDAGVDSIRLSLYSESEHTRLKKIVEKVNKGPIYFHPRYNKQITDDSAGEDIDGRLKVYDNEGRGINEPCFIPTMYYFVRNNADINMCFWDWKYTQIFGNLYKNTVEETLLNKNRLEINYKLINNMRKDIPVCSGCKMPAQRCISEYCNKMIL